MKYHLPNQLNEFHSSSLETWKFSEVKHWFVIGWHGNKLKESCKIDNLNDIVKKFNISSINKLMEPNKMSPLSTCSCMRELSHIYKSWRLKLWWVSAQWSLLKPDDQSTNPVYGKFSVIQQKGTQTSSITSIGAQLRHLNVLKSKYVWWASGRIKNYADNSRKEYNDEL